MDRLVLIDGYSLMHRAFYAIPALSKDGVYTNALFGFFNMLLKVIADAQPDYLIVTLDAHAPTFRHGTYAEYKAGRKPMPEELRPQMKRLREVLELIGIQQMERAGWEADDLMGTLSLQAAKQGTESVLVTGDRDSFQLIGDKTRVWFTRKGLTEIEDLTSEALLQGYGIRPDQVPDLKGLMGDSSDNIPGIAGVGEKTALKLLNEYDKLENVLANGDKIKGKLGERVRGGVESASMSKMLATIDRNAPVEFDKQAAVLPAKEKFAPAFTELGFRSLLERLNLEAVECTAPDEGCTEENWQEEIELDTTEAIASYIKTEVSAFALHKAADALQIADDAGRLARIPLQGDLLSPGVDEVSALAALQPWLCGKAEKRVYDIKAWRTELAQYGLEMLPPYMDAGIAGYLIEPSDSASVEKLCDRQLGAEASAKSLYKLADVQREKLAQQGMKKLYEEVELPLANVLFRMEQEGFRVDREALAALQDAFGEKIAEIQQAIYDVSGEVFNILSPKQLGNVLFEKLGLPAGRKTKSGYSTDAEVLEGLADAHPVVPLVLQYRSYTKLKSTYVDGLLKLSNESGVIHTTLNQMVTVTGRISSAEPNLQNIPVRTELGRVMRKVFVPKNGDHLLVDADYSQIELRVLAHMAQEENMLDAFRKGQDIHARTAAEVYDVELKDVTSSMRSSAKAVNFGIVYGISDFGLARNIGVTRKEAAAFIDKYFVRYPKIKEYMDSCVRQGHEQGYVTTLFGRRRNLPELKASNYNTRSFGERAAMNTPIQGTAADIIKIAMVRVHKALKDEGFKAKLILQVHDELIVDAPKEEAEAVSALLQREMESAVEMSIKLTAEVKTGASWYETK